jgi:AcrR family transcriptional regulator
LTHFHFVIIFLHLQTDQTVSFNIWQMDKKEQIVQVAAQLFAKKGFENTPLSLVCDTAKVSKGLIFHHFKSKNDLLRAIFSNTTQLIVEMNRPEPDLQHPHESLVRLIESFFTQLQADKLFFQLNLNMILQPSTRIVLHDLIQERSSFLLHSIRHIFDAIDKKNAMIMSYSFVAELDGIALNYLCIFEEYPLTSLKTHLIQRYTSS